MALGSVLAAGTSYAVSKSTAPVYESATTLLVSQAQTPGTVAYNDVLTSERLTKTYGELIRKRPVLDSALQELALPYSPGELNGKLNVRVVRDTMLLELRVEDTNPQRAADIANAVAKAFIEENRQVQMGQAILSRDALREQLTALERDIQMVSQQMDQLRSSPDGRPAETREAEIARLQNTLSQHQLTYSQLLRSEHDMRIAESKAYSSVSIAEPAEPALFPSKPKTSQNVAMAALVGLVLAVGAVLLLEYLDDTVKDAEDVEQQLGAPTLGFVLRLEKGQLGSLSSLVEGKPLAPIMEAFRVLRTNLQFALLNHPGKAILVTSTGPGEGKTTVVFNLAKSMANAGMNVVVVDADLRRPTLHRLFGEKNDVGLTTALLLAQKPPEEVIRPTNLPSLKFVPSGPLPPNPGELLGSARMVSLVRWLRDRADVVIFDSPPVLPVADPGILASAVDGVVVVVDSGRTRAGALARTRQALERAGNADKLLGAVINKLTSRTAGYHHYYYYQHYGYKQTGGNGENRPVPPEPKAVGEARER